MKLYAVVWSYIDWDEGAGGLDSIWSTLEQAETAVAIHKKAYPRNYVEVEEFELDGGPNE